MRLIATFLALMLATVSAGLPAQTPDLYDLDTVRSLYLTFKQVDWWQQLTNNYGKEIDIEADLTVDGKTYSRVGVRFRGNTSYTRLPPGCQKKGFNITTDAFVPGQDLLGYDSLNLNNGYHDPTFTREVITYQITRRYGIAPKANFVKLYLNNEYWGIYINVQQPEGKMMGEWFDDDEGNRYRGFPSSGMGFQNTALIYLGTNIALYQAAYQFKKGDGTDLMNMITVLNQTPTSQLQTELPKVWSVDQGFWYCIVMNALLQTDSYIGTGKDHFHFVDNEHGQFHMFPFDVNEAIGAEGGQPTLSPFYNSTSSSRPALSKTLQFADWKARYIAHYRTVMEESISWAEIEKLVTKYQTMIAQDVAADTKKIYTTAQFTENVTQDVRISYREVIRGMKPVMEARRAYLDTVPEFQTARPTLSDLQHSPAIPQATQNVTITVKASNAAKVTLHHRIQGPFIESPMFDDGQHGDGQAADGVWGAILSPESEATVVDYYASAATNAGVMRFEPATAENRPPFYQVGWPKGSSPVQLNEFVASNQTGIQDEASEFEDWLELLNTGTAAVDMSGCYLTDKVDNPTKWPIPSGTILQPGATLLIWCDEDANQGPLHANFKLSAGGEQILLFAADGKTQLDRVDFGTQTADVSTGRMAALSSVWATFSAPTPRAPNRADPPGHLAYGPCDSAAAAMSLTGTGTPGLGSISGYTVANAPASTAGLVALSVAPAHISLPGYGVLLVNPFGMGLFPVTTNAAGGAGVQFPVPNVPQLVGQLFHVQVFVHDGTNGGFSNGVVTTVGP